MKTTHTNLTRANEIMDTIIGRIEGSGSKTEKESLTGSNCLMNCAADCSRSSAELNDKLNYLAKLITGGC